MASILPEWDMLYRTAAFTDAAVCPNRIARSSAVRMPDGFGLIVFAVSVVTYAISFILIRTISRYREYAADRGSAVITSAPEHLMSALQKIASGITTIPQRDLR